MRKYEIMYLLKSTLEDTKQINAKIDSLITGTEGKIEEKINIGIRDLAYPIAKVKKANYFLVFAMTDAINIEKFKKFVKINKDILRCFVLNTELQKNYIENHKLSATEVNEEDFKKPTPYHLRRFNQRPKSDEGVNATPERPTTATHGTAPTTSATTIEKTEDV